MRLFTTIHAYVVLALLIGSATYLSLSLYEGEHQWAEVSTIFGALLVSYLAIFSAELKAAIAQPVINVSYSHETYLRYHGRTWFLFLTISNSSRWPLKNAVVKCVSATPNGYRSVESFNKQPTSPIPLAWCYGDAYAELYGETGGLHRTIYKQDVCGLLKIQQGNFLEMDVTLASVIQPNRDEFVLKPDVEYFVEVQIDGENFSPNKTWKFRIQWSGGDFPQSYDALLKQFDISAV